MKIIMWGVMSPRAKHPQQLHFRSADARAKCRDWTKIWHGKTKFYVQRFILDMKSETYYDIYKHEYKRI